ncbi:MAG: dockerin type I repeat-containing protein, partial [Oscillospiraceae bacterium]|nr:dockerin type I repeat-containing protein [Oscillospiraceae bacterium]
DTGGLVYDHFGTWDEVKYNFVLPSLWQTADGTFIGLDHKIPLGANGITVTEYYSGSPSTPTEPEETPAVTESPSEEESNVTPNESSCGDVNCDGKVSIADVLTLNKNLFSGETLSEQGILNADADADGTPTAADALLILKFSIGIITELPA